MGRKGLLERCFLPPAEDPFNSSTQLGPKHEGPDLSTPERLREVTSVGRVYFLTLEDSLALSHESAVLLFSPCHRTRAGPLIPRQTRVLRGYFEIDMFGFEMPREVG